MASWNSPVVTNKGLELMNSSINNKNIRITSIKISSQKLSGDLQNISTISNIQKEINPSSISTENGKIKISAILTNDNNRNGYNLETIGIYVTSNSTNILFAIITAKDSDYIPVDNGTGIITISFDIFININRDSTFNISHNTNALITRANLDTIIEDRLRTKANESDVVTNISINDGILSYIKNGNSINLTLPQTEEAQDNLSGKISKNSIRDIVNTLVTDTRIKEQAYIKMKEYGIGRNDAENYNLDTNLLTGLYVKREYRDFGNKTSGIVNFQYDTKWGVQLGMTSDDRRPTLYLRAKRNNTLTAWKEIATVDTVNEILNREVQRATFTEIWGDLND